MPELGTILGRLRERGIDSLNDMQRRMSRLKGRSALLLAPTGSGKTIAFALPLLMRLGKPGEGVRALVLAPSRELVLQIAGVISQAARGYKTLALYGGHPFREEEASLSVAPDIVVATPGRLLDHINRSTIDLDNVATLVIDEYDKQLELGFEDEMKRICRRLKHVTTRILTSATRLGELPDWLPLSGVKPEVLDFTEGGAPAPRPSIVRVGSPSRDKLDTLVDLLRARAGESAIVFVNHRESAERVWKRLRADHIPAGLYHGGLDQPERENALEMFANSTTPVLVSTDLGSRGLDIKGVDAVIHYHMPSSAEAWTHRNGRTARQGASGTVYVITAPEGEDIPEYVVTDRDWLPPHSEERIDWPHGATLYFNLGKKEKISRGDIVGFLIAKGGLTSEQIGRIQLRDHCALVGVPASEAGRVIAAVAPERIKNKRVKVTRLNP